MSEYTRNKAYPFINCRQTIRIWKSQSLFTTLNFADSSQNKYQFLSSPDFGQFHKRGSCSLKHTILSDLLVSFDRRDSYSYRHVWNFLKIFWNIYMGDFKKKLTFFEMHCSMRFRPGITSGAYTCRIKRQIMFASYRVHIYTPGWRATMRIKSLAEGQKCQAWTGIEPATLWSRVKGSIQYTTAPPYVFITGTDHASLNLDWPNHLGPFILLVNHFWGGPWTIIFKLRWSALKSGIGLSHDPFILGSWVCQDHLWKVLRPFCRPKFWRCVDLLSFKRKWLLKTSLEVKRLEIDY